MSSASSLDTRAIMLQLTQKAAILADLTPVLAAIKDDLVGTSELGTVEECSIFVKLCLGTESFRAMLPRFVINGR